MNELDKYYKNKRNQDLITFEKDLRGAGQYCTRNFIDIRGLARKLYDMGYRKEQKPPVEVCSIDEIRKSSLTHKQYESLNELDTVYRGLQKFIKDNQELFKD